MKANYILLIASALLFSLGFGACNDDVSPIGGSLASGEVSITVDSIATALDSECVFYDSFDSRSTTKLIGRINVPEYGRLSCSFVTRMMSAASLSIPDSITVNDVDSMRLVLSVPRGSLTGDSLAPQQLRVFRLDRQLPDDITASFNPAGYYDPSAPLGARSYTLSNIAKGDSVMKNDPYIRIPVDMPLSLARDIFTQYRTDSSVFEWPATFNQYFPGLYVEQNFGNGCIANVSAARMYTYWHYYKPVSVMQADSTYKDEPRLFRDSVCLMASVPEVLSSNVINYEISSSIRDMVAAGRRVMTTPGGCLVTMKFPVQRLLDEYNRNGAAMAIVSSLRFEIPATEIKNDYGISVAPDLLMIRKSEYDTFFSENKVPDNQNSFYAAYDSDNTCYRFSSMRSWFVKLLEDVQAGNAVKEEDYEFVLVPVEVTTESVDNYDGTKTVYVTACEPYISAPTMTELHTSRAIICFTYSTQQLR